MADSISPAAAGSRTVHATAIESDHALFVGQAAIADAAIARIEFDNVAARDHGIERIAAGFDDFHRLGAAIDAATEIVGSGHDDRFRSRLRGDLLDQGERGCAHHDRSSAKADFFARDPPFPSNGATASDPNMNAVEGATIWGRFHTLSYARRDLSLRWVWP